LKGTSERWAVAFIGLGSNLGERQSYLSEAIRRLKQVPGTNIIGLSRVLNTQPVDNTDQPEFLNQVVAVESALSPHEMLAALQAIEDQLGRVRTTWKGPRTIDMDILLFDDLVISVSNLTIPHPRLLRRPFFMRQILEIDPLIVEPVSCRPLEALLTNGGIETPLSGEIDNEKRG
jgi:2-amino-4-hydroxy-6-hydroxymethyldihydropteridine diphosphokinase